MVATAESTLSFQFTTGNSATASSPACQRAGRSGITVNAVAMPTTATPWLSTSSATARRRMPPVVISGMRAWPASLAANSRK